ncbi:hypothetical protein BZA05DRAFT_390363 [Tricharina praecox]|uniref:uncharacterized protein n=1 Tax=Tricharina praecox TaxID=43433 RepID=UPI0022201354|nr:uncharacterized protein BZA05DRAFT_390363 [Tricharina praecox]KAI5856022.1 hypothetical protein BZA05DRAFT_390363 [Tricharina praecox]
MLHVFCVDGRSGCVFLLVLFVGSICDTLRVGGWSVSVFMSVCRSVCLLPLTSIFYVYSFFNSFLVTMIHADDSEDDGGW